MIDRIIFLDVDGVLCFGDPKDICPDRLDRLCVLVKRTAAKIVVSSGWRGILRRMKILEDELAKRGVKITDATPDLFVHGHCRRVIEILTWVSKHGAEIEHWVAIDDDYLPLDYEHYVNTELWTRDDEGHPVLGDDGLPKYQGLTEAKAQELERKLMLYE